MLYIRITVEFYRTFGRGCLPSLRSGQSLFYVNRKVEAFSTNILILSFFLKLDHRLPIVDGTKIHFNIKLCCKPCSSTGPFGSLLKNIRLTFEQ